MKNLIYYDNAIITLSLAITIIMTELIAAIRLNNVKRALSLIPISDVGYIDENGCTALTMACYNNLPTVALALIATGKSNPGHMSTYGGNMPMLDACINNMTDVALALLATGKAKPEHGILWNVVRVIAKRNNMTEVVAILNNYDDYIAKLQQTANQCDDVAACDMTDPNYVMTIDI